MTRHNDEEGESVKGYDDHSSWKSCDVTPNKSSICQSFLQVSSAINEPTNLLSVPSEGNVSKCFPNIRPVDNSVDGLDPDGHGGDILVPLISSDSRQKSNDNEDDGLDEIEALLLRDQLLRSMTLQHQRLVAESKVVDVVESKVIDVKHYIVF